MTLFSYSNFCRSGTHRWATKSLLAETYHTVTIVNISKWELLKYKAGEECLNLQLGYNFKEAFR